MKVGGSVGHVSVEIAAANPDLLLIVQDFATLKPQFDATVPQELKPRITFQAHDFFNPQPIKVLMSISSNTSYMTGPILSVSRFCEM
jgi:hypothetical protein